MASPLIVFHNGPIVTMTGAVADWVAVADGRIVGIGDGTAPKADRVDLDGAALLPGFHDAHVHPALGGMAMIRCDLHDLAGPEDYVAAVAAYAAAHPSLEWVLGGGWAMDAFPGGLAPAGALDAVVPDRPVFLRSREGHAAWANSVALRLAGVDAATPDPPDGRIERAADGSPSGTLQEGAMALVADAAPSPGVDDYVDAIAAAQRMLLGLGVTSWQDAAVTPSIHDAYLELDRRNRLIGTVRGALWWDRRHGIDQIESIVARSRRGSSRFGPRSVKLMVDGVCENGTASLHAPYEGTESTGIQFIERKVLMEAVPRIMAEGLQPHFHAIGDRAITDALDAVAAGAPADIAAVRPHIAHIQVVAPDDIRRFADLGVAANAQALWACYDACMVDLTIPRLGPERSERQYPFRSLLDSGARLVAGSDWSVSTANPFEQIAVAVTRRLHRSTDAFHPEEAVPVDAMLRAFTSGSAWINHDEQRSGTIEAGKAADLIVIDRDPRVAPPDELAAIEVLATYVGGVLVEPGGSLAPSS